MARVAFWALTGLVLTTLVISPSTLAWAASNPNDTVGTAVTRGIIFVHGIHGDARLPGFQALLQPLVEAYPNSYENFTYFDDVANLDSTSRQCTEQAVPTYTPVSGFPVDAPQAGATPFCDSEDDVGLNAVLLDREIIKRTAQWGTGRITLIANSMGGAIVRAYLAYATETGSPSLGAVDSILFLQGAHEGSWLAKADQIGNSLLGTNIPAVRSAVASLEQMALDEFQINKNRPAIVDLTPQSQMYVFDSKAQYLPNIRYANVASDMTTRVATQVWWWTVTSDLPVRLGDYVMVPGFDDPTRTDWMGGERFLPSAIGRGRSSTQWILPGEATIRRRAGADGQDGWDTSEAVNAPMSHFQLGSQLANLEVSAGGTQTSLDRALLDWIAALDGPSAVAARVGSPAPMAPLRPIGSLSARPTAASSPSVQHGGHLGAPGGNSPARDARDARARVAAPLPGVSTPNAIDPTRPLLFSTQWSTLAAFEAASLTADWQALYHLMNEHVTRANTEATFIKEGAQQVNRTGRILSLQRLAVDQLRLGDDGIRTFRATYEATVQAPNGTSTTGRYVAIFLQQGEDWRLWFMDTVP